MTAKSASTPGKLGGERARSAAANNRRLALVLWHGAVGGAESFTVTLCQRLRGLGANAEVVFIAEAQPIAERLRAAGVPYRSLGFKRGRDVAWHPRRFAKEIALVGSDGAILVACGFMGAALRGGGYRRPIVAIEHGALLGLSGLAWPRRCLQRIGGVGGACANDAEVGVSDFVLEEMRRLPHARMIRRIYNGVEPLENLSAPSSVLDRRKASIVVAFAGRLIAGKGADRLIEAVGQIHPPPYIKLLIAGNGAERPRLECLADSLGLRHVVYFLGQVEDMPAFWRRADVAVVPSEIAESFSMTTLESMACARPVVATQHGAIPELVIDGATGTLVPPGDVKALADAIITYARHPELRRTHGSAARARAIEHFHLTQCAQAYLTLFADLIERARVRRTNTPLRRTLA